MLSRQILVHHQKSVAVQYCVLLGDSEAEASDHGTAVQAGPVKVMVKILLASGLELLRLKMMRYISSVDSRWSQIRLSSWQPSEGLDLTQL